jgi:hypothetical protein
MTPLPPTSLPQWQRRLLGAPGLALALVWGLAEGSFFFLIPDIIITLAALFSIKTSIRHLLLVVAGSLVAGAWLFLWSQADYNTAKQTVARVPFVREKMFEKTGAEFSRLGAVALFTGPMEGIPYKVYAVQAPGHCSLRIFLLASVPARLERLLLSWSVFVFVGWIFRRCGVRALYPVLFHTVYWSVVYACYWSII